MPRGKGTLMRQRATLSPEEQGEVTAGDGTLRIASSMSDDRQQAPRV